MHTDGLDEVELIDEIARNSGCTNPRAMHMQTTPDAAAAWHPVLIVLHRSAGNPIYRSAHQHLRRTLPF